LWVTSRAYGSANIFGRPFVKRFALCCGTVVLSVLSVCLSVTLVYCGQTAGWIKVPLGMEVGLGPGDIVRWEPDSVPNGNGHSSPSNFRLISIVAKRSPISATAELLYISELRKNPCGNFCSHPFKTKFVDILLTYGPIYSAEHLLKIWHQSAPSPQKISENFRGNR